MKTTILVAALTLAASTLSAAPVQNYDAGISSEYETTIVLTNSRAERQAARQARRAARQARRAARNNVTELPPAPDPVAPQTETQDCRERGAPLTGFLDKNLPICS